MYVILLEDDGVQEVLGPFTTAHGARAWADENQNEYDDYTITIRKIKLIGSHYDQFRSSQYVG